MVFFGVSECLSIHVSLFCLYISTSGRNKEYLDILINKFLKEHLELICIHRIDARSFFNWKLLTSAMCDLVRQSSRSLLCLASNIIICSLKWLIWYQKTNKKLYHDDQNFCTLVLIKPNNNEYVHDLSTWYSYKKINKMPKHK
jgi:hypothetical protein